MKTTSTISEFLSKKSEECEKLQQLYQNDNYKKQKYLNN